MHNILNRFEYLLNTIPALLQAISEKDFSNKPALTKWSKKEILGHLADSASVNYQRFIRAQFEDNPQIFYDQDQWCKAAYYQYAEKGMLITFWLIHNRQLLFLFKQLDDFALQKRSNNHTLLYLMEDYVEHLEHHLKQLVDYS
ncbi:DinB family protein [Olivibacter sp. SDN3]|uniref:DinB family protein n=1 Tax=Olivibacter sp. SDN3 TaxID=2764720 RepID=UPI001651736A|nr:DinB family protein [Olivibacter sp. SDN3]QNL51069.1 DinB family protein [Olivibacter sp. SDN3]